MKLNWELFNSLLERAEDLPPGEWLELTDPIEVEHVLLLKDGGLIEIVDATTHNSRSVFIKRITLQGHNYLGHIRNETVYRRLRNFVEQNGGKVAIDVLVALAKKYAFDLLT